MNTWHFVSPVFLVLFIFGCVLLYFAHINKQSSKIQEISVQLLQPRNHAFWSRIGQYFDDADRIEKETLLELGEPFHQFKESMLRLENEISKNIEFKGKHTEQLDTLIECTRGHTQSLSNLSHLLTQEKSSKPTQWIWDPDEFNSFKVIRFPHVLVIILQEWIYNCIKSSDWVEFRFHQEGKRQGIKIISSNVYPTSIIAPFLNPHEKKSARERTTFEGTRIRFNEIAELAESAYGRRPEYRWMVNKDIVQVSQEQAPSQAHSLLIIWLPLKRTC